MIFNVLTKCGKFQTHHSSRQFIPTSTIAEREPYHNLKEQTDRRSQCPTTSFTILAKFIIDLIVSYRKPTLVVKLRPRSQRINQYSCCFHRASAVLIQLIS